MHPWSSIVGRGLRKQAGQGWNWPLCALAMLCMSAYAAPSQAMSGDPAAVQMARGIVKAMGGREQWARTEWVYSSETAWFADRPSPARLQFWRRVAEPAEMGKIIGPGWSREHKWDKSGGYRLRDGVRSQMSPAELAQLHGWWRGEIYMMYVRFAREDPDLVLEATGIGSFRVREGERNLGEFFVDPTGALYRWRYAFGSDSVDYLYGPLRGFGPIRAPSWGALSDGSFRFFYTGFRLATATPSGLP